MEEMVDATSMRLFMLLSPSWIPAFAGMTVVSSSLCIPAPYRGTGWDLRGNHHGLAKATRGDENGLAPGTGNHKGCPYNRFAGAYFHSNPSCRLPPTPPIMKMAVRAIRESPLLREIGRGLFSEESPMSVATDTTNHENGGKGDSRIAPTGDWTGVIFVPMTELRGQWK